MENNKIKQILLVAEIVSESDIDEAIKLSAKEKRDLQEILIERDLISDEHLGQLIADDLGHEFVDLQKKPIPEKALEIIPELMARKQLMVIFNISKDYVELALNDPDNLEMIRLVEKKSGLKVKPYFATQRDIKRALVKYRKGLTEEFKELIKKSIDETKKKKKTSSEDTSIIKIVDTFIRYGYENMASDIHIEPLEEEIIIRYRIDGMLHDVAVLPKEFQDSLTSRIKIMARLRTDEHRAAQDGKLSIDLPEENLDIRVSVVPITNGEKIVMRLLSEKTRQFALDDLGLASGDINKIKKALKHSHGMILVTGPTGSGKTTTLYAVLKILNKRQVNITTIEDPVEYNIEGVNQIQVNPKTNLTFASGLRSIVRQDPDIIMVGEIRDEETAGIATNAALTGHLVLSTLHTNDAATTLPRLLDMKIEPFLIASTINIIIAQRLVRRICSQCMMSNIIKEDQLEIIRSQINLEKITGKKTAQLKELRFYKGKGCPACNNTGYKGRVGIYEILDISEPIKKLIVTKADSGKIKEQAVKEGMITMLEDGFLKAMQGMTTFEEVLRVISS